MEFGKKILPKQENVILQTKYPNYWINFQKELSMEFCKAIGIFFLIILLTMFQSLEQLTEGFTSTFFPLNFIRENCMNKQ